MVFRCCWQVTLCVFVCYGDYIVSIVRFHCTLLIPSPGLMKAWVFGVNNKLFQV